MIIKSSTFTAISEDHLASGDTIRNWIIVRSLQGPGETVAYLQETDFQLPFCIYISTLPNHSAFCTVVCQRIRATGDVFSAPCGMEYFHCSHTGENRAKIIRRPFDQYRLKYQIGRIDLDDATNNDTGMKTVGKVFSSTKLAIDAVAACILSFGHCSNLIVKAFC